MSIFSTRVIASETGPWTYTCVSSAYWCVATPQKKEPGLGRRCRECRLGAIIWNPVEGQRRSGWTKNQWLSAPCREKSLNHNRGRPTTPNDALRRSRRMSWSTVSKATLTSNRARIKGYMGIHAPDQQPHTCRLECMLGQTLWIETSWTLTVIWVYRRIHFKVANKLHRNVFLDYLWQERRDYKSVDNYWHPDLYASKSMTWCAIDSLI